MPKEVITVNSDGDPRGVVVGWGRGTDVQVATVVPDGTDPSGSTGQYVDLDRSQINRLIRNLRHARDQAYGRDE